MIVAINLTAVGAGAAWVVAVALLRIYITARKQARARLINEAR